MNSLPLQLALVTLPLLAGFASPAQDPTPEAIRPIRAIPSAPARVEVVFVLDTTGSMSGLIQSAKDKIWSIANMFALAEPTLEVHIGLVGYRDRGDAYVTSRAALTADLDAVYARLMDFQAGGGGDAPESVNQALNEGVELAGWSSHPDTYRVLFLVGDCPPHMDYEDDVKYLESCKRAAERGIVINTIQCGSHAETEPFWLDIAKRAEGRMFHVDQDGGGVTIVTPFDGELAQLSTQVDATRMWYGTSAEQTVQTRKDQAAQKIYAGSSKASQAGRCEFNQKLAGLSNWIGGAKELITDLSAGRVELTEIEEAELPEPLRKLDASKRQKHIDGVAGERARLQKSIEGLVIKRREFLEKEQAKTGEDGKPSWDAAIRECVQAQIQRFGITLGSNSPAPTAEVPAVK